MLTPVRLGQGENPPEFHAEDTISVSDSDILGVGQNLHQADIELAQLEDMATENEAVQDAIGDQVIELRKQWQDYVDRFTSIYEFVYGARPSVLQGLGALGFIAVPVALWYVAAGVAGIVTIVYGVSLLFERLANVRAIGVAATQAQTQKEMVETAADLRRQSREAQGRGDVTRARDLERQAEEMERRAGSPGPSGKPEEFGPWFMKNWKWLAIAGVGLVAARPIAEGLFGGGRRR